MKREDALRALADLRMRLRDEFAVRSLFLVGSVARDEARTDSDVDLLVEFMSAVNLP